MTKLQKVQKILGVKADDIWGPKSQSALQTEIEQTVDTNDIIEQIQAEIGATVDGKWDMEDQEAFNAIKSDGTWRNTKFTSFADPADVVAFNKCKRNTGKSDVYCFGFGDNGIGQFGKITAQDHTAMVAIHGDEMVRQWGSRSGAAHRPVEIKLPGTDLIVEATCEDRISAVGKVDLNPAAFKALGLKAPFVVKGQWRWKV